MNVYAGASVESGVPPGLERSDGRGHSGPTGIRAWPPVDRHYIERFLAAHKDDIRGRVLEAMDRR